MAKHRWSPGVRALLEAHVELHGKEETATLLGVDRTSITNWQQSEHTPTAAAQARIKERCSPKIIKRERLAIGDLKVATQKAGLKTADQVLPPKKLAKKIEQPQWLRVERVSGSAQPVAVAPSDDEVTRAVSAIVQQVLREQNLGTHVRPDLIRSLRLAFSA